MKFELSSDEVDFLAAQLGRHLEQMQDELARTEKHQLQHALARDVDRMQCILNRLTATARA
jgi:hypothetical protein